MNSFLDRLLCEHERMRLVVRTGPFVTAAGAICDHERLSVITHTGRSRRVGRAGVKLAAVRATVATPPRQRRDIRRRWWWQQRGAFTAITVETRGHEIGQSIWPTA